MQAEELYKYRRTPLIRAASSVCRLISELLRRISAWCVEMYPIPPMSAASAYTWSTARVACSAESHRRRSSSSNSSASTAVYSGYFKSTPRTQYPFCFRRVTRWCPMKPPAPVTHTRFIAAVLPLRLACSSTWPSPQRSEIDAGASVSAAAIQAREYRFPDDQRIERERPLLDVAQIETNRLLPIEIGATADLPQTGQARLHQQSSSRFAVVPPIGDRQRARTDQRHLTAQHVDQLGQLVERCAPQPAPQPGDPRIDGHLEQLPARVPVQLVETGPQRLGVAAHRAELPHRELPPTPPGPGLPEDRRPGAGEPDGKRDRHQHRRENDQGDQRHQPVEQRLRHAAATRQLRFVDVQQRQPADRPHAQPGTGDIDQRRGHEQVGPRFGQTPGQRP